jgi:type II secretory pathway component GspD/PulD (secretin)
MPEPVKNKVVIVPEVLSNCLIVTGPPAAVDEVRRLVNEMDRPAPIVRLEVQLTEEKEPLMQAELSTLDNQEAYIQFGQQESLISGVSMNNVGASHALTPVQVGTIIQMTPRVATGGKVSVYFNIQDSRLDPFKSDHAPTPRWPDANHQRHHSQR